MKLSGPPMPQMRLPPQTRRGFDPALLSAWGPVLLGVAALVTAFATMRPPADIEPIMIELRDIRAELIAIRSENRELRKEIGETRGLAQNAAQKSRTNEVTIESHHPTP